MAAGQINVLHIISDDLAARLGCYGDPLVKTPNIDRLAARGVKFDRAYCQYALCNPSRSSFLTGLRPDKTQVFDQTAQFRKKHPNTITLPQSFRRARYLVSRVGKIFQMDIPGEIGTSGMDDAKSWDTVVNPKGRDVTVDRAAIQVLAKGPSWNTITKGNQLLSRMGGTLGWLADDGADVQETDGQAVVAATQYLSARSRDHKPFYLAVGFVRPHTPFVAPKSYFAMYPLSEIVLPVVPPFPLQLFPRAALATRTPIEMAMTDDLRRSAIQGYDATITFMDAQVGLLLDALDRLNLSGNTIVVFHSDHGFHLGEKGLWQKESLFEECARVPLIIAQPSGVNAGQTCSRTVELVDLYKTLTDLCGVAADPQVQGDSMTPLLNDPAAPWLHAAFTQVSRLKVQGISDPMMGRSVRNERWRYTEWKLGEEGVELYDHEADPEEMHNLAVDPDQADVVAQMKALLRAGGD